MMKKQFNRYETPYFTVIGQEDVLMASAGTNDVIGEDKDWGNLGGFTYGD